MTFKVKNLGKVIANSLMALAHFLAGWYLVIHKHYVIALVVFLLSFLYYFEARKDIKVEKE